MLARRTEIAGKLGGECSQIYGLVGNLRTACFDAGEIKQRVDKLQQPKRVAMGDVEPFAFVRRQVRTGERVLQRAERQRQGVRNSWLTLEKNKVLARSISANASARLRSPS